MTPKPDDAKLSLAERIEALADEVNRRTDGWCMEPALRAIAGELREIANNELRPYTPGSEWSMDGRDCEEIADRLARKEAP